MIEFVIFGATISLVEFLIHIIIDLCVCIPICMHFCKKACRADVKKHRDSFPLGHGCEYHPPPDREDNPPKPMGV